jgi:hypothetical protein
MNGMFPSRVVIASAAALAFFATVPQALAKSYRISGQ